MKAYAVLSTVLNHAMLVTLPDSLFTKASELGRKRR